MRFYFFFCFTILTSFVFGQNKMVISEISINGNKKTKEHTILRELYFAVGDSLNAKELVEKIEQSKKNIETQWLFNFIDFDFKIKEQKIAINIDVVERWYIWPYPILEISERNFNVFYDSLKASNYSDFSKLNYGIFLNVYNFRGRNELLQIKYRKGYKEHYLFDYYISYLNQSKAIGLNIVVEQFRMKTFHFNTVNNQLEYFTSNETQFKDFKKSITLQYKPKLFFTHKLSFENSVYTIPDDPSLKEMNFIASSSNKFIINKVQYLLENEKRNSISYPTEGGYNMLQFDFYKGIDNDFQNISLIAKNENHFRAGNRFFYGYSLKGKVNLNDSLPYVLNESLGFEDYLRGYEYFVIDGGKYIFSKTAFKYSLIPKKLFQIPFFDLDQFKKSYYSVYLSIFADMGIVYDKYTDPSNKLNNNFLFSQGVSLDFVTYYDKLLRLEYSRNHLNEWGFFIHFSNPF